MVTVLGQQNSIANNFLAELRNIDIQRDSQRFRKNLERLGEIFAYEISKKLPYQQKDIDSPLGIAPMNLLAQQPVVATILRAGLPFHHGMLNFFDHAESAFVSAYRKHEKDGSFIIQLDYISAPDLNDKILILADPMLATGGSAVQAVDFIKEKGCNHIKFMCIIAAPEGLSLLQKKHSPFQRLLNISMLKK